MKPASAMIVGAILLVLVTGCSVHVKMNEENQTKMGSHQVVVKPGSTVTSSSSSTGGDEATYQYSCGDVSVTIQNEKLIVNNINYGRLNTGEPVLIDNGKVSVAGQERQGTPMSDQEIQASASVAESTKKLAGYNVTVRPGSSFTSTTQFLGENIFTVGNTKVSIKNDELFVNGTSYGRLKPGDTILVESKKVSVSGKIREPKQ